MLRLTVFEILTVGKQNQSNKCQKIHIYKTYSIWFSRPQ